MKVTKQSRRDAKALFRACQVNGVLDENRVRQAVDEVLEKKPRGFAGTLSHFVRLVRLEQARRTARIESSVPLSPELQSGLKAALEKRYGQGLHFVFGENPDLIGGVRVQIGSDVYDGSIRARLDGIYEDFKAA